MADEAPNRTSDRLEVSNAIVLSLAGLASAWATYQASLWDGEQAAHYSRANALRIQASRERLEGDTRQAVEVAAFNQWLNASARGEARLARFYQARLPDDLKPAFNAWMRDRPFSNPSAAATPFTMESYRAPRRAAAARLDREADATFEAGERDNVISDGYAQGSTILASALFFGGIGQVFRLRVARIALLAIGILAMAFGLLRVLSLPVQVLGLHPLA